MGTVEKTLVQLATEDKRSHILRWFLFLGAIVGFLLINYTFFQPVKKPQFDALNSLAHEAILLEERALSDPHLDYPSQLLADITQFLKKNPELGFVPHPLDLSASGWHPEGTSIIEYEAAKIAMIQFFHPQQNRRIFQFIFLGDVKKLPPATAGVLGGLTYQGYGSKEMNLIAWQEGPLLSFVAGRSSIVELAETASQGVVSH
jgi:hypothetical protein